jgi:uncharacterized protein (TIGR02246 family)
MQRSETMNANEEAVASVLANYQDALNGSNTDAVMQLYSEDGVFMPPYSQSAIGAAAVRQAYDAVFKAIKLSVKFNIAEIVAIAPDWAFARTNSAGTTTINATGAKSAEANQELFIFQKGADGKWKIARYSFSSTNPPPQQ